MSILNYKIEKFPDDLLNFLSHDTTLDVIALFWCAIIYWGGIAFWIYLMVFKLSYLDIICIWSSFVVLNLIVMGPLRFPGIFYLDKGSDLKQSVASLLGPPGFCRFIVLASFHMLRTGPFILLTKPTHTWEHNSRWAKLFRGEAQRRRDRQIAILKDLTLSPKISLVSKIWDILNKRIEII